MFYENSQTGSFGCLSGIPFDMNDLILFGVHGSPGSKICSHLRLLEMAADMVKQQDILRILLMGEGGVGGFSIPISDTSISKNFVNSLILWTGQNEGQMTIETHTTLDLVISNFDLIWGAYIS